MNIFDLPNKLYLSLLFAFSCILCPSHCFSEDSDQNYFALVNGRQISTETYQFLLGSRDQEDQSPLDNSLTAEQITAQRAQAAKDLVITEVLAQEALRAKVDQQPENAIEIELARKTLLAQLMVKQIMNKIEVSEADIKAAYDAEKPGRLFRFNLWITPTESDGRKLLDSFQNNKPLNHPYETIETPWLDQSELGPTVIDAIEATPVGDYVSQVIFQDGLWKVVQLIDKNILNKPPFEEAREIIKTELIQAQVDAEIERLSLTADIQLNTRQLY